MKTLTVTEAARNFSAVLDELEREQEEVMLVRDHRQVARLVPEARPQDALEVFGDLYGTLDDETADALVEAMKEARANPGGSLGVLRDPWAS